MQVYKIDKVYKRSKSILENKVRRFLCKSVSNNPIYFKKFHLYCNLFLEGLNLVIFEVLGRK